MTTDPTDTGRKMVQELEYLELSTRPDGQWADQAVNSFVKAMLAAAPTDTVQKGETGGEIGYKRLVEELGSHYAAFQEQVKHASRLQTTGVALAKNLEDRLHTAERELADCRTEWERRNQPQPTPIPMSLRHDAAKAWDERLASHAEREGAEPVAKAVVSNNDGSVLSFHLPWEKMKAEEHPWVKTGGARISDVFLSAPSPAPDSQAEGLVEWKENVKYLLDSWPESVRHCYKHGPEDLLQSLVITFIKMREALRFHQAPVGEDFETWFKREYPLWRDGTSLKHALKRAWNAARTPSPQTGGGSQNSTKEKS